MNRWTIPSALMAVINYIAYTQTMWIPHLLVAGFITGVLFSVLVFRIGAEPTT